MNSKGYLSSISLRLKILIGLFMSLLPLLAIVGITYFSALDTAENSKRIVNLISKHGAKEINGFIKTTGMISTGTQLWYAKRMF